MRIFPASDGDCLVPRIIVRFIPRVQCGVLLGQVGLSQHLVDLGQVEVGRIVLGIKLQRFQEIVPRLVPQPLLLRFRTFAAEPLGEIETGRAGVINDSIVLTEIVTPFEHDLGAVGQHALVILDGVLQVSLLGVHAPLQPVDRPDRQVFRFAGGSRVEHRAGFVQTAFQLIDAGQIKGPIKASQRGHLLKHLFRLPQLPLFAFQQQTDSVVVPPLPLVLDGRWGIRDLGVEPVHRQREPIRGHRGDGEPVDHRFIRGAVGIEAGKRLVPCLGGAGEEVHVLVVELAVLELDFDGNRPGKLLPGGNLQLVMHDPACAGGNLVVVERGENVLRIAAIDAVAIPVEHEDVDEVGVAINFLLSIQSAAAADNLVTALHGHVHPHFVGIHGSLRERVPQLERADDRLQQVFLARFKLRLKRAEWCVQRSRDEAPFFTFIAGLFSGFALAQGEDVHANAVLQEILMGLHRGVKVGCEALGDFAQIRGVGFILRHLLLEKCDGGICTGEEMVVDAELASAVEIPSPKITRRHQVHVAAGTLLLSLGGKVEALGSVRDAAEEVGVVVVLAAEEFLVMVQFLGQMYFVAGRAEFGGLVRILVERLEEGLLVEGRLGLHELVVDVLQNGILAGGEGIMHGLFDHIVGVAFGAVDVRDGVADGAGDAGVSGGIVYQIVFWVVELAAEERHGIVAAGAPTAGFDVAVPFESNFARLFDTGKVRGIIERAEMMGTVEPAFVSILMALQAVAVHHQGLIVDELAIGRRNQGWFKILPSFDGAGPVPAAGVLRAEDDHAADERGHDRGVRDTDPPLDLRPRQAMEPIQPAGGDGDQDMQPVNGRARDRMFEIEQPINPHEQQAGDQHHNASRKQRIADADGPLVLAVPGRDHVDQTEGHEGHDEHQAQRDVQGKHAQIEVVLVRRPRHPLERRDAEEEQRIGRQQGDQREHDVQQHP